MKKILVPCDFSENAKQAYLFAMNIAEQTNGQVLVLKVIDLPYVYESTFTPTPYYNDPEIIERIEEDAEKSFEQLKEQHLRKANVTFTTLRGPVTLTIRQFIKDNNIDLVVMGTLGASGWQEYLIGSNTEKIVRFSPVPVFAIRKAVDLDQIKNIVFPTTMEPHQLELVKRVKELQELFKARLHLLLINTPYNMRRSKDEKALMEDYANDSGFMNYTLNTRNDFYEQDGIINFAHEINADLIVMGTHGRRGLAHLFIGSVTEDVVNHVDCPIWTYSVKK